MKKIRPSFGINFFSKLMVSFWNFLEQILTHSFWSWFEAFSYLHNTHERGWWNPF